MTAMFLRRDFWLEWLCLVPLAFVIAGGGILFGGSAWWFRPVAIACIGLTSAAGLVRLGWRRDRLFLASPLLFLGASALGWSLVQCVPLPVAVVSRIAPASSAAFVEDRSPSSDPTLRTAEPTAPSRTSRIPISLDRSATVRRSVWTFLGLCVFWFFGRWTDRSQKLLAIAGLVIGLGAVHSAVLTLQMLDGSTGLFGLFEPDRRFYIGPGWVDIGSSPHRSMLEKLDGVADSGGVWSVPRASVSDLIGIMPGGFVSYACLQSVALPMTFGCLCFLGQRRGSRFSFTERLADRGVTTLWCVMTVAGILGTILIGMAVPLLLAAPIACGIVVCSAFALRSDLERWVPLSLTILFFGAYALGSQVFSEFSESAESGFGWFWRDPAAFDGFLKENLAVWRSAGWTGVGFGAYSMLAPYVKSTEGLSSDATSSAVRLVIELGGVALVLAITALAWIGFRTFRGFRHVGVEHRCLLGMTLGSGTAVVLGYLLLPGWDLPILALIAASVMGVNDRVLCQASDLFMESWDEG